MATGALLLSVGSEILRGETVDTNAAHLGAELTHHGFSVLAVRVLADERAAIARAVREAVSAAPLVILTGGLGPTHDDLTREGVADALGEALVEDAALVALLRERFRGAGRMASINLRQALRIPSAEVLSNPIGSAPGWWVELDRAVIVALPGVPSEMRRMFAEQVLPRLRRRYGERAEASRVIRTYGVGESALAERLREVLEQATAYEAGIYARDDGVHVRLSSSRDPGAVEQAARRALELAGVDAYGTDADDLATAVQGALRRRGVATLASIERGTGGALLALLVSASAAALPRYVGGVLAVDRPLVPPAADVVLGCEALADDGQGRSRVRVTLTGAVELPATEVRIHGSGPQRLRRAAFAALDTVRRALMP